MSLTPLQKEFKEALFKIEFDEKLHTFPQFCAGTWGFAKTDKKRQAIINNILNGKIKTYEDVMNALH